MNFLDMRTIVLSNVVTDIVCVWFVVMLWRQSRDRFAGTAFWVLDFVFQAAALILIVLRGAVPDWISMVLANTLVIVGAILGLMGLERFVGKKSPQIRNYLLLTLFILVHGYFAFVQPSLALRKLNFSVALFLVCFQCFWLLWRRVEPGLRSLTFGVGVVFFLYCLVSVVRIVQLFIGATTESNYLQSSLFEALVLVCYQVFFILLTYNLVLMVNKRLLMQIGTQEEKFAKAFHSAPYAITLTRPSDGTIIDVNETFFSITGYDRTEVMGTKTTDLHLWEHDEDRAAVVDILLRKGGVHGMEMSFRKKNGEGITGLFSAEVITIDGEKNILSSIGDITERKQAEEEIQRNESRLRRLVDILQHPSETIQDFLDYALDQAIQLTGSKIGYIYHYHEDRKEFVLNTWSKEVMAECAVANPPSCYELDKTGIWGEAVRQRRPIMVNDFPSAHPLKKGYPEGHVQLLKFMTVPIFKDDSIVGVVGLANKETDYEETDILQVSLLMEAVWKVTDRKKAEEALKESENRYRELSIVDDLTHLYNSRHFYFQLKMEIDRADRYQQPLTILLLDLDDFKVYNDVYGHVEGDQVLFRLGQVVKRCLRQTDTAYRYGGEEFTILLPMTTSADGAVTAERIRMEFKQETFLPTPGQEVHVTVSIGLAQYKPQEEMKVFVNRVDKLMYQGKKSGKDRVCCES